MTELVTISNVSIVRESVSVEFAFDGTIDGIDDEVGVEAEDVRLEGGLQLDIIDSEKIAVRFSN